MTYAVPATTKLRIAHVLQFFFAPNVAAFCQLLLRTGAHIMGSLPLFCLKDFWMNWIVPNDVDVFLCPTTPTLMRRNISMLQEFLIADGYGLVASNLGMNPYMGFNVMTFVKPTAPGRWAPSVQLIIPSPRIRCSPIWHLIVMYGFDLTCCCVGFDGQNFHVTVDNLNPTTERVSVRRMHPTTPQRIVKYHNRGFRFL